MARYQQDSVEDASLLRKAEDPIHSIVERAQAPASRSMAAEQQGSKSKSSGPAPAPANGAAAAAELADAAAATQEQQQQEKLYSAFNALHTMAQAFEKPFDAPAVVVVGYQTDGKSALVEALMGFQFNHVGGGTKTRRPVTLHMVYDAGAATPRCWLMTPPPGYDGPVGDDGGAEMPLEQVQRHIRDENDRLEREGRFSSREVVVRVAYRCCPNLTIIDTPGLIAPAPNDAALAAAARQVEDIVLRKLARPEYTILCLEDCGDWSNATTRRTVMRVDPALRRTVLVSTKFDTRLPQFSTPGDAAAFLQGPSPVVAAAGADGEQQQQQQQGPLGGAPFFTSVPSGRVGDVARDATFRTNDDFRAAVAAREAADAAELEKRLQRRLTPHEAPRLGVRQLRRFLEALLRRRYLEAVPAMLPLLEREQRAAEQRLAAAAREADGLASDRLRDQGRAFREAFLGKLALVLRGTVAAPADVFGETLADEQLRGGGAFCAPGSDDGRPLVAAGDLPNANMRLFGGAQFHRAMGEFRAGAGAMPCPRVSREDVVNACGVDDVHDGVNLVRTACVIAVAKSREALEPLVHQLGRRLAHVLRRILPIALHLLHKEEAAAAALAGGMGSSSGSTGGLSQHELFVRRVGAAFDAFIDEAEAACRRRCLEDLTSTTRFVTWSLHTKSAAPLRSLVGRLGGATAAAGGADAPARNNNGRNNSNNGQDAAAAGAPSAAGGAVLDLLDCTLWQRQLGALSEETVAALVALVFEGVRDFIVQSVELKMNCFFLMELVDAFPQRLRQELEAAFEADLDGVFDVRALRAALDGRRRALEAERAQVERLRRDFSAIHATLAADGNGGVAGPGAWPSFAMAASARAPPTAAVAARQREAAAAAERQLAGLGLGSTTLLVESTSLASLSKLRLPRPPTAAGSGGGGGGADARGPRDKNGGSGGGGGGGGGASSGDAAGRALAASAGAGALAKLAAPKQGGGGVDGSPSGAPRGIKAHAVALSTNTLAGVL